MDPKDIIPLIEGKVQIGNIPIDPGVTNAKNEATGIIGFNTENSEIQEGVVRFDIVFYVKTKSGKAQISINVEAQKSEPDKYDIINRGIFYVSRLISSQKGRDFVKSNYNDIKSVHSIWLCMNMDENCLNHIKLTDDKILGNHTWRGNLSLFNLVMIGITKKPSEYEEEYKLHRLLSSVLSDTMSVEEKLEIIENEYDIPVEGSFREDVDTMCNLSQEIEEKGIKEGIGKGKAEIILNMYEDGYSVEQIAKVARMDKESIEKICKKL